MRILSLTAGAATMYCGSCLRDNALANELIARGHEVTLLPVYTPTVTDEPNASEKNRVFFGGVSVYLQQHLQLFRKSPAFLDRLWDSSRFIRFVSRRSLATDGRFLGEMTVSMLKGEHGHQRKELDKLVAWLREHYPNPDVINLPFALLIGLARPLREALGGRIVCTLQGEDLFLDQLQEPWRAESLALIRDKLVDVDLFVAVSDYYARTMPAYLGVPTNRIHTVPLGINFKDFDYLTPYMPGRAKRTTSPQWPEPARPFTFGYFARIAPEKGLDRLVDAYVLLRRQRGVPPSRLEAAGWMGADQKPYLAGIERTLRDAGLEAEFKYRGELSRLDKVRFLAQLDVFSMPAPYREPKGLSVLEAMAAGVPVVQPAHGAFPEMLLRTGGGVLVAPDDTEALAEGMWQLWQDTKLRATLGQRGAANVRQQYGIARSAARLEQVYTEALTRQPPSRPTHPGGGPSAPPDTEDPDAEDVTGISRPASAADAKTMRASG